MWGYVPEWDAFPEYVAHLAADHFTNFINFFAQFGFKFFQTLNSISVGGVSFFEILIAFILLEVMYHVFFIHS